MNELKPKDNDTEHQTTKDGQNKKKETLCTSLKLGMENQDRLKFHDEKIFGAFLKTTRVLCILNMSNCHLNEYVCTAIA